MHPRSAHFNWAHSARRIGLTNQPLIEVRKAEYSAEFKRYEELNARIYQAKPPHEDRARRRRIIYCWSVTAILVVAGFVLCVYTFEPYELGLKGLFYCLGIAISVPYLVETALNRLASEKLIRVLVTVAGIVALVSVMTLGVVRGELLARHTQEDSSAVAIEGEEAQTNQSKTPSFYNDTVPLLQMVMVLLVFAMEIGAGIAMHEAERVSANLGESYDDLQRARAKVQEQLAQLAQEILVLQSEPALYVSKFWRDFHWAVLKRSIGNAAKAFMVGALSFFLLSASTAQAWQPLELVVLIDLSQSVGANGPDRRSEFQKNVAAVSHTLRQVPARAHVTVLGITDDSFAQPYFLLSATVTSEVGYFGEKLASARRRLEIAWKARSRDLAPSFPGTDLFGALLVASEIFQRGGPSRRDVLVVFSDMWHETREFNFGKMADLCSPEAIEKVKAQKLLADLRKVDVYALGTDSPGRKKSEWGCAHELWMKYFLEAQANLRTYSVLRSLELNVRGEH